jgi:hypothetical protein
MYILPCRGYIAPEYIDKGILSFKADIFSFGVTIMNLLIGQRWDREQSFEQVRRTFQTTFGSKGCY